MSLVIGKRTTATLRQAFADFYQRTDGNLPALITTDEYAPYITVIVSTYGVRKEDLELTEAQKEEYGWAEMPAIYFPVEINYATVHKEREQGRVVRVEQRIIFGTAKQVKEALEQGSTAPTINTNYVERWNGTQRNFNARKTRKTYCFSKELAMHLAVSWLCIVAYNFNWEPRTLRQQMQEEPPRYRYRTPAMAAGLTEQRWSLDQILGYPIHHPPTQWKKRKRRKRKAINVDGE